MGIPVMGPYITNGAVLRSILVTAIADFANYAAGNFSGSATAHPVFREAVIASGLQPAETPTSRESQLIQVGSGLTAAGIGMMTLGGGAAALSGSITALTGAQLVLLTGGGIILVIGIAALLYVGYRVFTQREGVSPGPYDRSIHENDPIYKARLNGTTPLIYPGYIPPPEPAEYTYTVNWGN